MYHLIAKYVSLINLLFLVILLGIIAGDVFILRSGSDIQMALVGGLWIFVSFWDKKRRDVAIFVSMSLLVLLFFVFLIVGASFMAERIATWLYIFMGIALLFKFLELWSHHKDEK